MKKSIILILATFCLCGNLLAQQKETVITKQIDSLKSVEPSKIQNPVIINGNKLYTYNARTISTNFTIPLVRVNFLVNKPTDIENKKASVSFFSSIGAGVGYYWGRLESTEDAGGNIINQEMTNIFGFQCGFLFAANGGANTNATGGSNSSTNIFGLTGAISILNFQVGGGYELGTIATGQRRGFLTIAYSIPLSKLVKGGYFILKKSLVKPADKGNAFF